MWNFGCAASVDLGEGSHIQWDVSSILSGQVCIKSGEWLEQKYEPFCNALTRQCNTKHDFTFLSAWFILNYLLST